MPAKTVLVVDDEATIRLYFKAVLQQDGFQTIEASDGVEALAIVRKLGANLNLLLSDIRMPNMDGIALARAVLAESPAIPLILISGDSASEEALELKIQILQKPLPVATLLTAVRKAMTPKKQPRAETEHRPYIRSANL